MHAMQTLKQMVQTQLLAGIPTQLQTEFRESLYRQNMPRFAALSFALVFMDSISLCVYTVFYTRTGVFFAGHILVHALKILCMFAFFIFFSRLQQRPYVAEGFCARYGEVLFPFLYAASELVLFASGSRDLAGLLRIIAVPFVVSVVPVLNQLRSVLLQFLTCLGFTAFVFRFTQAPSRAGLAPLFVSVWVAVFVGSVLCSALVYSAFVNTYVQNKKRTAPDQGEQPPKLTNDEAQAGVSHKDPITGLPTRQQFHQDMEIALQVDAPKGYVILFDISNFKSINGVYSHNIGDKTLEKVGRLLNKMVPENAKLYHYSVDQFMLSVPEIDEKETAEIIGRVQQFFSAYSITVEGVSLKVGFCVGALSLGGRVQGLDDLMVNLDIALQHAKHDTKQSFRMFSEQDKTEYISRISLEKELNECCLNEFEGFALHYQPLFGVNPVRCVGTEALLRWSDSTGEFVPPMKVIPVLERSGLIVRAGSWILQEACRQCAQWIQNGANRQFFVHVNLSPVQIDKLSFVDEVLAVLGNFGLRPCNLVLELTESSFVSDTALAVNVLNSLRRAGVRVSVDDFGTGYSSLSYLRMMPADQIKIDKSFLDDIETDESARKILKSVTELAKGMGFEVCVEGVETEGQMRALMQSPVDVLQGFLLGRPVPPNVFAIQWMQMGKEALHRLS